MIKPSLHKDYAAKICDKDNPVTDQLLGADLPAQVKNIQEQQKVSITPKVFHRQTQAFNKHTKRFRKRNFYTPYGADYNTDYYNNGGYSSPGYHAHKNNRGGGKSHSDSRKPFLGYGRGQNHQPQHHHQKDKKQKQFHRR
jgi:hypothetical protein